MGREEKEDKEEKTRKSFNLKKSNADKIEDLAFNDPKYNKKQSAVVDEAVEKL